MRDAVICEPVRTPVGRYGGSMVSVPTAELGATAVRGLLERTKLDPALVDDVILGWCNGNSEAPALGRVVAMDAGLPSAIPGYHLDRRCGSGLQAIINGSMAVQTRVNDLVIAGGAESMSNASFYSVDMRWGAPGGAIAIHDSLVRARTTAGGRNHPVRGGMLETAENLRRAYSITRVEQDELAVESHRRAVAAQNSGVFAEEIIPVTVAGKRGDVVVDRDEHPRPGTSVEALAELRPLLLAEDPESTVTAGNASGQNDAAAVCIVTAPDVAESNGLRPLVRLRGWAVAGVPAKTMGIGPVPAVAAVMDRTGLSLADMDVIELNEAFAAQAIAVIREWKFTETDLQRTNIHGSGISLGHPVGATGARMVGAMAREVQRRDGRYGLVTMCIGGGQGLAAVFEAV